MKLDLPSIVHIRTSACVSPNELPTEIVERKGVGHPDTLADGLAESVSLAYSRFCLDNFGVVLHHHIDKLAIKGGRWSVEFGKSEFREPIRVVVNGRFSTAFGGDRIPLRELVENAIWRRLSDVFQTALRNEHVRIEHFYNAASNTSRWYEPESLEDLPDAKETWANDTSVVVSMWPMSRVESLVLEAERFFYVGPFKKRYPYLGQDIKIMAVRIESELHLTICIPFIAEETPSREFYLERQREISASLLLHLKSRCHFQKAHVYLNTQDNNSARDHIYLTPFGSCIGIGEEGVVGRGNNLQGLIPTFRPHSMEAPFGKNPTYHTGRIMAVVLPRLARALSDFLGGDVAIQAVTQNGGSLLPPGFLLVQCAKEVNPESVKRFVLDERHYGAYADDIACGGLLPRAW